MTIKLFSQLREKRLHLTNPIESGTHIMYDWRHWMNKLHISPSLITAFVSMIAFYIILTKRKRSKEKISEHSAKSDLNENDDTKRVCSKASDPYDEDRSFQHDVIGPNGPQEIKFVVSTPPSELVPLLHSGMKHASIRRQLVFNLQKMTWERRQPIKMYQEKSERKTGESNHGIADKKKDEDTSENEKWQRVDNALPIESLLNVDCNSMNLGTIEITFDKSIVPDQGKALIDEDSLLNQVTPETWKRDNTGTGEIALDFSSIDCENDNVDDQSLLESISIGNQSLNVGIDNDRNKASKQHKKKDTGGILNSIKGKTLKGKKEYTFKTELEAAMFQTIFLGMRVAGREIQHMYSALEDIHRASDAYNRNSGLGGIALDDVRRCLSDLPTIDENMRHIIRCNYDNHSQSNHDDHIVSGEDENVEIHEMYLSRRLILGLVDFFWLFLPKVLKGTPYSTPTATKDQVFGPVGGIDEHQARVRQLIKLRKLIAAASLRVSSYVEAMRVVQSGWQHHPFSNSHIKKRLAYDRRTDNENHDCLHFHEYYEPLLLSESTHEAPTSFGQAFLLVGCKAVHFKAGDASEFSRSNPADIPSIREILDRNRNSEFLILSLDSNHSSIIMVFIKWLPKGIDTEFDSRYYKFLRNELKRDDTISLHLQSPDSCNIFTNFIDNFIGRKDSSFSKKMMEVINIGNRSKTNYFGQGGPDDDDLSNYIAVKYKVQVDIFSESWKKSIGNIIPEYGSGRTTDLVFQFDSLNTRPLAAIRLVNIDHNVPLADSLYTIAESEYFPAMDTLLRPVMSMDSDFIQDGDSYKKDIDSLKDILGLITVPVRQVNKSMLTENNEDFNQETITDGKVLEFFTDKEMLRHFQAAGENIKEAAIRITKAAAFKGLYFPIDIRSCQVELKSGQCFQLGFDKSDNPVIYFRNMCKGLWRKNIAASVAAALYNVDTAFEKLNQTNPDFKVTLVVLMGKSQESNSKDSSKNTSNTSKRSSEESHNEETSTQKTVMDEEYVHTNFQYVQKLIRITSDNYPQRLGKALVVPTTGWEKLVGVHGLRRYISSQETRNKVKILDNLSQLKEYISSEQLVDFAGGELKTEYI